MCKHHIERLTSGDHVGHGMFMVSNPRETVSFRCALNQVAFADGPHIDVRFLQQPCCIKTLSKDSTAIFIYSCVGIDQYRTLGSHH